MRMRGPHLVRPFCFLAHVFTSWIVIPMRPKGTRVGGAFQLPKAGLVFARHSGEPPKEQGSEALFNSRMAGHPALRFWVVAITPDRAFVALPRSGRLRSGRFDRLPPLESLFFCWPKRKVTQRKWPLELKAHSVLWDTSLEGFGARIVTISLISGTATPPRAEAKRA